MAWHEHHQIIYSKTADFPSNILVTHSDQVRINAQLIDATSGGHVWADRYDGSATNIFAVQDEFIRKIVKALAVNLTEEGKEEIGLGKTTNIAAREAFQKGWDSYLRYSPIDNAAAVGHLKAALELDPVYGQAYAALGMVYLRGCQLRWHKPLQMSVGKAFREADKYRKQMEIYPSTLAKLLLIRVPGKCSRYPAPTVPGAPGRPRPVDRWSGRGAPRSPGSAVGHDEKPGLSPR